MRLSYLAVALALGVSVSGCGDTTASRSLSGGALGAGGGALVGAIAGNTAMGAAIGGGVGLLGGYLYDQHKKGNID